MRQHFCLDPGLTFLNHGSFGACPLPVLEQQSQLRRRLEASPVQFMLGLAAELWRAKEAVAPFVGAAASDLVFVRNATEGVNAVLRSIEFERGDEILVSDHTYGACANAAQWVAERAGARLTRVRVPFPVQSAGDILQAFRAGVSSRTKLALFDHVTSLTGLVFPVAEIAAMLRDRGVLSLVDGAHAPGMVDVDLRRLGVDFYAANFHKWVCAPKGAGMLWVRPELQERIAPPVLSHGASAAPHERFHASFDWTGTSDPSAWLCVAPALDFMGSLLPGGWEELRARNHSLILAARDLMCAKLGLAAPVPGDLLGSMASLPLPEALSRAAAEPGKSDPLYRELFARGFETLVHAFPLPSTAGRSRPPIKVLRVCAQVYNELGDYERLAQTLLELS